MKLNSAVEKMQSYVEELGAAAVALEKPKLVGQHDKLVKLMRFKDEKPWTSIVAKNKANEMWKHLGATVGQTKGAAFVTAQRNWLSAYSTFSTLHEQYEKR